MYVSYQNNFNFIFIFINVYLEVIKLGIDMSYFILFKLLSF